VKEKQTNKTKRITIITNAKCDPVNQKKNGPLLSTCNSAFIFNVSFFLYFHFAAVGIDYHLLKELIISG